MNSLITHAAALRQMADLIEENETLRNRISALELELQQVRSQPTRNEQEWYTSKEAAKYIGLSTSFLEKDRIAKTPKIPFTKHGHRTCRYHKISLDAWLSLDRKSGMN